MSTITSTPITSEQLTEWAIARKDYATANKKMQLMLTSQSLISADGSLNVSLDSQPLDLWLRLARGKAADFKSWIDIPKHIRPLFTLDGYQAQDPDAPVISLIVRPTGVKMTEGDVRNIIARFGPVRDVYIPLNVATGNQRPFAFVEIIGFTAADEAVKTYTESMVTVHGRQIHVELAINGRKSAYEMRSRFY
jgi:hypothetical protein